jgi:hypothetical protein
MPKEEEPLRQCKNVALFFFLQTVEQRRNEAKKSFKAFSVTSCVTVVHNVMMLFGPSQGFLTQGMLSTPSYFSYKFYLFSCATLHNEIARKN